MTCCEASSESTPARCVGRQPNGSKAAHARRPWRAKLLRQPQLLSRILHTAKRVHQQQKDARLRQHRARALSSSALNKGRKSAYVLSTTTSPSRSWLMRRMRSPVTVNASRTADGSGEAAVRDHASPAKVSSCVGAASANVAASCDSRSNSMNCGAAPAAALTRPLGRKARLTHQTRPPPRWA